MKRPALLFCIFVLAFRAGAQTGFPPYASFEHGRFDSVNRQSLNVIYALQTKSSPGRGLPLGHAVFYNSLVWGKVGNGWVAVVDKDGVPTWGWNKDQVLGQNQHREVTRTCFYGPNYDPQFEDTVKYYAYSFVDPTGTSRGFSLSFHEDATPCNYNTGPRTGYATDGSGYYIDASYPLEPQIWSPDGVNVTASGGFRDSNGNYISQIVINSTETHWKDTLGRVALKIIKKTNPNCGGSGGFAECYEYKFYDSAGTERTMTLNVTTQFNVKSNFQCSGMIEGTYNAAKLPRELVLPTGQKYTFDYEDGASGFKTGRVSKVTLPTGGFYEYSYPAPNNGINCADGSMKNLDRKISDGTLSTWTYRRTPSGSNWITKVTEPPLYGAAANESTFSFDAGGKIFSTKIYQGPEVGGTLLRTVATTWAVNGTPLASTVTLEDGAAPKPVSKVETDYDTYGNLLEVREYAIGSGAPGALVRRTTNTYTVIGNIRDRVTQVLVKDGAGAIKAKTIIAYDGTSNFTGANCITGAPQHDDTSHGCDDLARGNPITITRYTDAATPAGPLVTNLEYDSLGNLRKVTDPAGHQTTLAYDDNFETSPPAACLPPSNSFAYVKQVTNALSQNAQSSYYACTGLLKEQKDPNDIAASRNGTRFTYDLFGRPTQIDFADGGQTTAVYTDAQPPSVQVTQKIDGAQNLVTNTIFDTLGRPKIGQLTSDPAGTDFTRVEYDALGRAWKQWNPSRCNLNTEPPPTSCTGENTFGLSETQLDALGRVTKAIPPDGSPSANRMLYAYAGNAVTITDPAGKQRKVESDALGRVQRVWEPDSGGAFNNATVYQYNVLDLLLCVHQKGNDATADKTCDDASVPATWRPRKFTYDSVGRALTAITPETGTTSFNSYDSDGNLLTTSDARSITTTLTYDALHRLLTKSYSDGTPTVTFSYDTASVQGFTIENPIGRLVYASKTGAGTIMSYDPLGRVTSLRQCTPANCGTSWFSAGYTYNNLGEVLSQTNPWGFTVTYTYNAAAALTQLSSSLSDPQHPANLASAISYNAVGALAQMTLGNNLVASATYNNRVQPCRITYKSAGTSPALCADPPPSGNKLDLSYGFNHGTANNGSVTSWSATGSQSFTRTFTYDELNRLGTMASTQCNYTWSYDIWGNRTGQDMTGGTGPCNEHFAPGINTKNQIYDPQVSTAYQYDAAGNTTVVPDPPGRTYQWDAENRMKSINSGSVASYDYDAFGRRIRSTVGSTTTDFVYDLGGNVIAQWRSGAWGDAFVYFGSQLLAQYSATNSTTYFALKDHLGSTRIFSKMDQTVDRNYDYQPFGEGPSSGSSLFTGLDRDSESGLDHTWFRKYSSQFGRWLSPDPLGGAIGEPQSLNRYAYVSNDPINFSDPLGLRKCYYQITWTLTFAVARNAAGEIINQTLVSRQLESVKFIGCQPSRGGDEKPDDRQEKFAERLARWLDRLFGRNPPKPRPADCPPVPQAPAGESVDQNSRIAASNRPITYVFPLGTLLSGGWFYTQVRNGGPWDYKQRAAGTLNDYGEFVPGSPYEDFGNFNYGATGQALGLPASLLYIGAGFAATRVPTRPTTTQHLSQFVAADDFRDQVQIGAGIQFSQAGCRQ